MGSLQKIDRFFERIGLEWTYVLWSPSYPYKGKVGYSGRMSIRLQHITDSIREETGRDIKVYVIFKMPMFAAQRAEKAIHYSALWRRVKDMPGSGCTEWGHVVNVFSFIFSYILLYGFGLPLHFSLIALVAPIPLDFAVFILLMAVFQYAIAGVALYGIWNTFF